MILDWLEFTLSPSAILAITVPSWGANVSNVFPLRASTHSLLMNSYMEKLNKESIYNVYYILWSALWINFIKLSFAKLCKRKSALALSISICYIREKTSTAGFPQGLPNRPVLRHPHPSGSREHVVAPHCRSRYLPINTASSGPWTNIRKLNAINVMTLQINCKHSTHRGYMLA